MREQTKEKEEIIRKLRMEDDQAMNKMLKLESQIQLLEKNNEKNASETVEVYQGQIKKLDHTAKTQVKDLDTKLSELKENLNKMEKVGKEKARHEAQLTIIKQDCESLEKTIKEEKYRIDIALAKMAEEREADLQHKLQAHEATANHNAERNVQ